MKSWSSRGLRPWFGFSLLLCLGAVVPIGCGGGSSGGAVPVSNPSAARTVTGVLVTAAGDAPADYAVYGFSPDAADGGATPAASVSPGGRFSVSVPADRASILLAVPADATAAAVRIVGGKGLYLSPVFGSTQMVRQPDGSYALSAAGSVAIDAKTTMLSAVLVDGLLFNPNPAPSQSTARFLIAKANAGWPELDAAAQSYDATVASPIDTLDGPAFAATLDLLVASVANDPPPYVAGASLPKRAVLGTSAQALGGAPFAVAESGKAQISLTADDATVPTFKLDDAVGTNLDYLCEVSPTVKTDFPAGEASPNFTSPNRYLTLQPGGAAVRSAFVNAKSYASYLDVIGNGIDLVTGTLGGVTIGPSSAIPAVRGAVLVARCFSGGYGSDTAALAYVSASFAPQARSAFEHNVAAACVEVISAIPGGDAAVKNDIGKAILQKIVQTAALQIEAKANAVGTNITASDIYEIIYNTAKAGLNEVLNVPGEALGNGALQKLASFLKWGGKSVIRLANVPGKVANGGAAASRAYAIAAPQSVYEYFLVAAPLDIGDCRKDNWCPPIDAAKCVPCVTTYCVDQCAAFMAVGASLGDSSRLYDCIKASCKAECPNAWVPF